ncbi:MAG: CoA-binding protein, partial [Steroidobacteraceae bacterium]
MTAQRIEAMLRPSSVALVGASEAPGSIGDVLRRNLLESGFRGPVHLINPRHPSIGGVATFPDVRSLPQAVDLALVASPPVTVPQVLEQCGERGVRGAVIVAAGFREGGEPGAALEREVLAVAGRYGLRLLGPNSFGVIRTDIGLNAACGGNLPMPGRLA